MSCCLKGYPHYEFSYDEEEGKLVVMNAKRGIEVKQRVNGKGYLTVGLSNGEKQRKFRVSRLILILFGPPQPSPEHTCDHINRDRLDNRLENLRWASKSEQSLNQKFRGKGYCWHKSRNQWQVQFKGKHIGRFKTEEEAKAKVAEIRSTQKERR